MSALIGSDFPNIPDLSSDRSFIINQAAVKRMMNQVSFAMGINDQRAVLNGTFFKITDNTLMMVACDSFKLAKCQKKTDIVNKNTNGVNEIDYKFIVPAKTMNELNRLISDDDEALMQIYVTRKHIVFMIGDLTFFSRLVDGEYIDFDRIIMMNHRIKVRMNKRELISALERAALVTEEKIAGSVRSHVKLDVTKDVMKISAVSSAGSTYDELMIGHDGDDLLIAFNNRYLIDSVRACSSEELLLSMSSPLTSMNIQPADNETEGDEEIFMLLPVRMKE
jgi:DNA polymerase-3 subunit beta